MTSGTAFGPLHGLRVADFSRVLAGPYASMLLADMGADVIKVERPPHGDDTRAWGPPWTPTGPDGAYEATYFLGINRNKRSVAIDLHTPEGRAAARQLILASDVLIENFKAGTLDRLGLGEAALRIEHPGLIRASITGFGRGAGAHLPGYDLVVQAVGGLMSITGGGADQPTKVGVALVDVITGLHAALGVVAAVHHRDATGGREGGGDGQHIEVNLLSSLLSALVNQSSAFVAGGVVPGIMGNEHPSIAPYEVFQAADKPLVLAVGNDGQFARLCEALGEPAIAHDPRFATNPDRVENREVLRRWLTAHLAERSADQWFADLMAVGVPCGPINGIDEAIALADSLGLDPVTSIGGVPTVSNPIDFSASPVEYRRRPPQVGEHTAEVFAELGIPSPSAGAAPGPAQEPAQ